MKNFILILTLLLLTNLSFSQNTTITGTVTDNNQIALLGVNVYLKNTTKGTQTNEYGGFEIANLENGDYILSISYLGFKTREISISISNNQNTTLENIILYEGNEILSEVVIEGERRNKFSRKNTAYVSKMPLKDLENSRIFNCNFCFVRISNSYKFR